MQPREDDTNTPQQPEELSFNSQPSTPDENPVDDPAVTPASETPAEPTSPENDSQTWGDVADQEPKEEALGESAPEPETPASATPSSSPTASPVSNNGFSPTEPTASGDMGMVPPMAPQAGGKSRKGPIVLTTVLVLLLIAGGLAYWFLLRPEEKTDTANNRQTDTAETIEEEDLPPSETALPVINLENKVIEDTDMGYKVTVTRMVPNFPVTNTNWSSANEAVLVEFKVETTGKFNGAPGDGNLRLIADNGLGSLTTALISDDEIKAQGFTPFPDVKATKETPAVGFLAFAVPKGAQKLTVRYERMAATNISTGETIPAKNFDIALQ